MAGWVVQLLHLPRISELPPDLLKVEPPAEGRSLIHPVESKGERGGNHWGG